MREVKNQILKNLQQALIECNYADIGGDDEVNENDIYPIHSRQESTYGHISDAIRSLGGDAMIEYWIQYGEFENI